MRNDAAGTKSTLSAAIHTVLSPGGIRGALLECAWVAARVATYPLGLLPAGRAYAEPFNLDGLAPVQRGQLIGGLEAAGTPVLLVHGIVDHHRIFTVLRRALLRRGFSRVDSVNYGWFRQDVRSLAAVLREHVERFCQETGYERLHIIGHSLGGLVARYYVQRLGGDHRVHTLVTLGSPHRGTRWAHAVPHPLLRQLRPGSDVLAELDAPSPGCRTRFVVIWSDLDQIIVPQHSARLRHPDLKVRNVFVRSVGHLSLPVDRRIVQQVCDALACPDPECEDQIGPVTGITNQPQSEPGGKVRKPANRQVTKG